MSESKKTDVEKLIKRYGAKKRKVEEETKDHAPEQKTPEDTILKNATSASEKNELNELIQALANEKSTSAQLQQRLKALEDDNHALSTTVNHDRDAVREDVYNGFGKLNELLGLSAVEVFSKSEARDDFDTVRHVRNLMPHLIGALTEQPE